MSTRSRLPRLRHAVLPLAFASLLASGAAHAFRIQSDNRDVKMSWDTTVKYSAAWRVRSAADQVAGDPSTAQVNTNDGDLNFDNGLISNRLDVLTSFDLSFKRKYGLRVSGQGWYDSVYHDDTDNPGNLGINQVSTPADQFVKDTEQLHGQHTEFMDAFIYGNFSPKRKRLNLKLGRFTQLYGESLFFGANGVAGAQTPLDLAKALSVPNPEFKEVARPVGQVSAQLQLNSDVSIGAYYQWEWRKTRVPGAGSYFSFADFADEGGERLLLGPGVFLHRGKDIHAKDNGQGGVQLRLKSGDNEFGLYAAVFHDKMPQFYARPGVNARSINDIGDYVLVYGENIRLFGGSLTTLVGDTNVAAELSIRENMPLVAAGNTVVIPGNSRADGGARAAFPKGKTLHFNASAIGVLPASRFWDGASFVGEFAFNHVMAYTDNADRVDPSATRSASAIQAVFQPEYFQVLPGLDLQVPIGISYGIDGRSSVNGALFPSEHGGSLNLGLKAKYQQVWHGSVNYTHYFGPAGAIIRAAGTPLLSYDNFHGDRDFVSVSVERTF